MHSDSEAWLIGRYARWRAELLERRPELADEVAALADRPELATLLRLYWVLGYGAALEEAIETLGLAMTEAACSKASSPTGCQR